MPCTVSINLDSLDPAWQYGNPLNDSFSKHVTNPFSTFHIHLKSIRKNLGTLHPKP